MNAVVKQEHAVIERDQPSVPVTPMQMLQMAVSQNADLDKLQKLMDLQERWEKNEARKAFVAALTAFKSEPPELSKNKQVSFDTNKGRTEYRHATLDQVSVNVGKALALHGLSHRWDVEQLEGGIIRVTCVLTHSMGHSERVPMEGSADQSGGKNSIQAIGSTVTYLQRYTLLAATGMAVKDQDNDGGGGMGIIPEMQRADFIAAIDALADDDAALRLWQSIVKVCKQSGDKSAYDDLKQRITVKRESFKVAA